MTTLAEGEVEDPAAVTDETTVPSWTSLVELAETPDGLKIDDGTAEACATMCAELMSALAALQADGLMEGAGSLTTIAPLSSLEALDYRLTGLGTALSEILGTADKDGTHLGALDGMLETFTAAGKAYLEADGLSSDGFLEDIVPSTTGSGVTLTEHSGEIHSKKFLMERLEAMELIDTSVSGIEPDPPRTLTYEQLYSLGEYIKTFGLAGLYESKGTKWYRWGDTIRDRSFEFKNDLTSRTRDAWHGDGAAGAVLAVDNYVTQLDALREAIWRVGDAFRYASIWLELTAEAMPDHPVNLAGTWSAYYDPTGAQLDTYGYAYMDPSTIPDDFTWRTDSSGDHPIVIIDDPTRNFQDRYNQTYATGFRETVAVFPKLPAYQGGSEIPPPGDPFGNDDTDDGGGGGGETPEFPAGNGFPGGDAGWPTQDDPSSRTSLQSTESYALEAMEAEREAAAEQQAQQMAQGLQQAMGMAQQAVQDALGAVKDMTGLESQAELPAGGLPPLGDLSAAPPGLSGLGAGLGGGSGPGGNATASGSARPGLDPAKLFPRASLPGIGTPAPTLAANSPMNSGAPMGGAPMGGGGAPAGGRGQGEDKHERAKYLDNAQNLDEVLGDPLDMTRSVVGETGARPVPPVPPVQPHQPSPHQPTPAPHPQPRRTDQPVIVRRSQGT
ncbi:hypothetical protein [Nocardia carnea]|uniref:hypothetical protein n=1 Tax=Nocardia carnea TaxID=37328 RepID=UPI0024562C36|nr:hypothetical protein [Nocardia carnea]